MDEMKGKVVVVTGGSSGLGRATALRMAEEGAAAIVIADRIEAPREGGQTTVDLVKGLGVKAEWVETDVRRKADLERAVDVAERYGPIDVMVNNAGVFRRRPFLEIDEDEFDFVHDVNLKGVFFGCQVAAARMASGSGGSIVNLSSIAAYKGGPGQSTYHSSKGGVRSLTYALATELASSGVRVNAVHPGPTESEMLRTDTGFHGRQTQVSVFPLGRPTMPEDVADAVLFLASERSRNISGASLTVDGGALSMG